ncbi:hypothetical protein D6783_04255 [Candidatus Woesearchaeota archaeon]|nr:MAG: hypothetical protein D6783_04255 [Candidatus Woesearchaeota archaeon]
MRVVHIQTRLEGDVVLPQRLLSSLPRKVALFTTAQLAHVRGLLGEQLREAGKEVVLTRMRHTWEEGQLLGCSTLPVAVAADAFLYVGDGEFHPQALVIGNELPVFCFNPVSGKWCRFEEGWIRRVKRQRKGALAAFFGAKRVGVVVTTKSGQQRLSAALSLRERFVDKEFFVFLMDVVVPESLEDFPFVEVFVNTACPRLGFDDFSRFPKPVVNLDDVGIVW